MSDSFIIYTSYLKIFEQLTDAQLGQLTRHMLSFAKTGKEPSIEDPLVKLSFAFIKDDMERNQRKYEEKCERLRANARKRWDKKQLDSEASEDIQKHTNVCKSMQMHANAQIAMHNDNDNEYVNDNVDDNDVSKETNILEPSKEASMQSFSEKNVCAAAEPQKSSEKKKSKKGEIDYAAIKDYWNEQHDKTNSAMRRLTLMTDNRKEAIRGRLKDCKGDISKIYLAIDKAMASDYLNAGHSWASYDWVMTRKYFPKVLEGNYDNTKPATSQQPQSAEARAQDPAATARPSIGERYEQAKHRQPAPQQSQDDKFRWVIQQNLADLKKNPRNKPAKDSLARFYEKGVLQRLGIDWKPEK
uniref:DUF6291 domain-containing protein n=1 Tax=Siphoviridae sp. cttxG5 TaxID=2826498 RepID=A0A8S5MDD9_9CAUD|nr:MAG TPA: hypothetical protein [Siphoviridae sp. cttxG5]